MSYSFKALKTNIAAQWSAMKIPAQYLPALDRTAAKLVGDKERYLSLERRSSVPAIVTMVIAERESGADPRMSLAQGDRWDRVTVHVPKGRGPFKSWEDAAVDALQIDGLDRIGRESWTIERALFQLEKYNGFGYRRYGVPSAYVWASTTIYQGGKFIADGKFSRSAWDIQLGVAALMARIGHAEPALMLPGAADLPHDHPIHMASQTSPETAAIQKRLNELGANPPLVRDGLYGPKTREAIRVFQRRNELQDDGIVGPVTWKIMNLREAA
ncbi:MAG TPA: peptidoglycan-binding protein [Xanthobacteraceae bacterium]|nr:peptidoglycan-binding protein [Xanthobacteraceae bacterium]